MLAEALVPWQCPGHGVGTAASAVREKERPALLAPRVSSGLGWTAKTSRPEFGWRGTYAGPGGVVRCVPGVAAWQVGANDQVQVLG